MQEREGIRGGPNRAGTDAWLISHGWIRMVAPALWAALRARAVRTLSLLAEGMIWSGTGWGLRAQQFVCTAGTDAWLGSPAWAHRPCVGSDCGPFRLGGVCAPALRTLAWSAQPRSTRRAPHLKLKRMCPRRGCAAPRLSQPSRGPTQEGREPYHTMLAYRAPSRPAARKRSVWSRLPPSPSLC
jgi:hypothetical protein